MFGHIESFLMLHRSSIINLFEDTLTKKKTKKEFLENFILLANVLNMYKPYSSNYKTAEAVLEKLR